MFMAPSWRRRPYSYSLYMRRRSTQERNSCWRQRRAIAAPSGGNTAAGSSTAVGLWSLGPETRRTVRPLQRWTCATRFGICTDQDTLMRQENSAELLARFWIGNLVERNGRDHGHINLLSCLHYPQRRARPSEEDWDKSLEREVPMLYVRMFSTISSRASKEHIGRGAARQPVAIP